MIVVVIDVTVIAIDRSVLDVLRPVNRERSYQGETKCIPTTSKILIDYLNTYSTVEGWRNLGKMKLNEPGESETR